MIKLDYIYLTDKIELQSFEYGLNHIDKKKKTLIFIHGAREGSPLDFELFYKKYGWQYNIFALSYDESFYIEKISSYNNLKISNLINKNITPIVIANSYGTVILRYAVLLNTNIYKNINIINLVPLLGGSAGAFGLCKFPVYLRNKFIKWFGDGASIETSNNVDPLGDTIGYLFDTDNCIEFIRKIKTFWILKVDNDENSPEFINFWQKILTTKKERRLFLKYYTNGLLGANIKTFELNSKNPHDDSLISPLIMKYINNIIINL